MLKLSPKLGIVRNDFNILKVTCEKPRAKFTLNDTQMKTFPL